MDTVQRNGSSGDEPAGLPPIACGVDGARMDYDALTERWTCPRCEGFIDAEDLERELGRP